MSCIECPKEIHVGDYGTRFKIHITECDDDGVEKDVPLATATMLRVWFLKSDETTIDEVGTILNPPGDDGIYYYDAQPGEISVAGDWQIQGQVTFPGGQWHSCSAEFEVFPNIL